MASPRLSTKNLTRFTMRNGDRTWSTNGKLAQTMKLKYRKLENLSKLENRFWGSKKLSNSKIEIATWKHFHTRNLEVILEKHATSKYFIESSKSCLNLEMLNSKISILENLEYQTRNLKKTNSKITYHIRKWKLKFEKLKHTRKYVFQIRKFQLRSSKILVAKFENIIWISKRTVHTRKC